MNKKIIIVASDYYHDITENLYSGVVKYIEWHNNEKKSILENIDYKVVHTPGSFEIPFLINKFKDKADGFIALGCIIRGETYHFEIISNQVSRKIMDLSVDINKPIGFGVLTCDNLDQAEKRSDPKRGNKGEEAAIACIKNMYYG